MIFNLSNLIFNHKLVVHMIFSEYNLKISLFHSIHKNNVKTPRINFLRETNISCDGINRIKVDYFTNECN